MTGQPFRRFKGALGDFIYQLVGQSAEAEHLYDEFMMDYALQARVFKYSFSAEF